MKVIRDEDKKSPEYILRFEVEKGTIQKNNRKNASAVEITTENYNDLVAYMADGSKKRYDNIEENKVRLLRLMTKQHLSNREQFNYLKEEKCLDQVLSVFLLIANISIIVTQILTFNPNLGLALIFFEILYSSSFLILFAIEIFEIIKTNNKIKEIEKNRYLFIYEEVLNKADLENKNILENVKDKDKVVIAEIKEEKDKYNDKPYFDINSIDKLSLDALEKIKANIERENYLGLVTVQEEVKGDCESKGRPKVKK